MTEPSDLRPVPAVSIGLPVYNGASYIREALDSLLAQTFADFELIISDNASTDATETICRDYAARDRRMRYYRQTDNRGALANFLFVLDQAVAPYFMWAAHDDLLKTDDVLFRLVRLAQQSGADLVFPNVDIVTMVEGRPVITQSSVMNPFLRCQSKLDECLASVRLCNYQLYGLYRRASLRPSVKYLERAAGLRVYGEGLFVQAVIARLPIAFAHDATMSYRLTAANASRAVAPPVLLRDYIRYSLLSLRFWLAESPLPPAGKVRVALTLVRANSYPAFRLLLSVVRFYWRRGRRWAAA